MLQRLDGCVDSTAGPTWVTDESSEVMFGNGVVVEPTVLAKRCVSMRIVLQVGVAAAHGQQRVLR
jgi:hypothetical protein